MPKVGTTSHAIRTGYVNSKCLTNQFFKLEIGDIKNQFNTSSTPIYLKFILNPKPRVPSPTTQNVLVVLKCPATMRSVSDIMVDDTAPCLAVQPQIATAAMQAVCTDGTYQAAVTLRTTGPAKTVAAGTTTPSTTITDVQVYPTASAATVRFSGTAAG